MSSRVKKCDFEKCLDLDATLFSGVNHILINGASLRFVLRWSIGLYLPSGNRARCNAFPNRKFGLGPGSFRRTATDWCFKRTNVPARTAAAKNSDETAAATRIIFEEVMQKLPYLWHNHKVYIIAWLNKVRGTSVHLECPSIKCFASACSCLLAAMIYFCAEILGPRMLISDKRSSFPVPVVRSRSLACFCHRKHKKSTAHASRSWKNLSSACRQV